MSNIISVVSSVVDLLEGASKSTETLTRVSVEYDSVTNSDIENIISIVINLRELFSVEAIVRSKNMTFSDEGELSDLLSEGDDCSIYFSKSNICSSFNFPLEGDVYFYFRLESFSSWLAGIDPFDTDSWENVEFREKTNFLISDLQDGFGGECFSCHPLTDSKVSEIPSVESLLPCHSDVQSLVHIISSRKVCISPRSFEILWGDPPKCVSDILDAMSAVIYTACVVIEFVDGGMGYEGKVKGTKQVTFPIDCHFVGDVGEELEILKRTVEWVYEERRDTRLRLVMDRLSIESDSKTSSVKTILENIEDAFLQARDSYSYVILERKDEYYKELREIMKDVNTQATIYSDKVRSIVSNIARDVLGIFLFLGLGFIGKLDSSELNHAIESNEFSLFSKFLSMYLLFSMVIQLVVNYRDSRLTYAEGRKWIKILRNYTSVEDGRDKFVRPINKRLCTLNVAMVISFIVYSSFSFIVYNLPFVLKLLLNQ